MTNRKSNFAVAFLLFLVATLMIGLIALTTSGVSGSTRGDANNDNSIDMKDILVIRRVAGMIITDYDKVACDTNGDNEVDMKDVLMIRKYVAGLEVSFAPLPGESTDSSSSDKVTLSIAVAYESPRDNPKTYTDSIEVFKGINTIQLKTEMYKPKDYAQDVLNGFSKLTNCTMTGDAQVGDSTGNNNFVVTYTYEVNVTGNMTIGGSFAGPNFREISITVNGQGGGGGGTSSTTSTSKSSSGPTASTTTKTRTNPTVTDGYLVQLDVPEEAPRYTTNTRDDWWEVEKNSTVTFTLRFKSVYRGNQKTDDQLNTAINLSANGQALSFNYSFGQVANERCDIFATTQMTVSSDTTISGSISNPAAYTHFIALIDGIAGIGGYTGGVEDAIVYSSEDLAFDQLILSFHDDECSTYGLAWHTYKESSMPVLQLVEGNITSTANFTGYQTISATSASVNTGYIYADYNPYTDRSFTTVERIDGLVDYTHKATFPTLKSNTTYSYRVGDTLKGDYSDIYTFTTRDMSDTDGFTFAYTSDSQWNSESPVAGSSYKKVLDSMLSIEPNPAFLLHGGDVVDEVPAIALWGNQYGTNAKNFFSKIPMFAATGNHDSPTSMLEHFNINSSTAWYSYDYQNTHFIVLDNGTSSYSDNLGTAQLSWLQSDLSAASTKGYDWIIVSFHKPMYCPKQLNQNNGTWSEEGGKRQQELTALFAQYNVDLVLQAHTHQYGRTYPMTGVGTYQQDYTTSTYNNVEYWSNCDGPIYTVMSTACNKPDPAISADKYPTAVENAYMCSSRSGESESFGIIQVDANRLTISVYHDGTTLYEKFGLTK